MLPLLSDEDVPRSITDGLSGRGVNRLLEYYSGTNGARVIGQALSLTFRFRRAQSLTDFLAGVIEGTDGGDDRMKPTVYLDATIPSFYFEDRPGTIIQAWHEITVEFWDRGRFDYDLYVSDETLRELQEVGYAESKRQRCLAPVEGLPRLASPSLRRSSIWRITSFARERCPSMTSGTRFIWRLRPGTVCNIC